MCNLSGSSGKLVAGTVTDQTSSGLPRPGDLVWLDQRVGPWFAEPAWARVIDARRSEHPPGWLHLDVPLLAAGAGAVTVHVCAGSLVVRRQQ